MVAAVQDALPTARPRDCARCVGSHASIRAADACAARHASQGGACLADLAADPNRGAPDAKLLPRRARRFRRKLRRALRWLNNRS